MVSAQLSQKQGAQIGRLHLLYLYILIAFLLMQSQYSNTYAKAPTLSNYILVCEGWSLHFENNFQNTPSGASLLKISLMVSTFYMLRLHSHFKKTN